MKKMYLLVIAALLMGSNTFAQLYGQTFGQTGLIDPEFNKTGMVLNSYSTTADMAGHTSVLQPDGKIIMAGGNGSNQVTFVRYNADGTSDYTFGTSGKSVVSAAAGNYLGGNYASLAVQADGKIILATAAASQIALVRLKTNGTADSAFGTNGISYAPAVNLWASQVASVAVKPDGKILTGGIAVYNNANHYYEVAQFKANGLLDSSFATNGRLYYNCGGLTGGCYSIALLPSGNIIAGGIAHATVDVMLAVNLKPSGVIDSTYGTNGHAICKAYLSDKALFCRVALQKDSKVLLIGYGNWLGNRKAIGLGRFFTDGKPDTTFAYQGTLTTTFENFSDFAQNVNEQYDGTLVVSGYSNNKFAMMRLKTNGTTDTTYGRIGKVLTAIPGNGGVIYYSFMQPDGKLVLTGSTKFNNVYSFVAARFVVNPQPHYNTLKGYTFLDYNANGIKDPAEPFANNVKYTITKANRDSFTIQSSDGKFLADVLDTGTYVSNAIFSAPTYYTPITPVNHITSNATYFNVDSVAFMSKPLPGITDVCITLVPCTVARPGNAVLYALSYKNVGTAVANGTLQFVKSSKLNYAYAAIPPSYINGDTLRWNYTNFAPGQSGFLVIHLFLPAPPAVNIGDTIRSSATITSDSTDAFPSNNFSVLQQIATNSYDPNNKLESHGGKITAAKVAAGEYLTYTINFQNTGTDTAINIFIRDTLSSKLDWNSLQMISASANYQLIMNDGKCLWAFNNINLPDSGRSGAASQGYLTYMIKPKPTVQIGDVINNTAAIYFDYNLPIYTNTNATTVVSDAQPLELLAFTAKKDGKVNRLLWNTSNEVDVDRFEAERSGNGREFSTIGSVKAVSSQLSVVSNYAFTDYSPLSAINYYRLKMLDKDGRFTYSPVRVVNNSGSFYVTIHPNPVKDRLQVEIAGNKKTTLQMQIIAQDGKALMSQQWNVNEGTTMQTLNVAALQSGSYFLKLTSDNKEMSVVKFEKL